MADTPPHDLADEFVEAGHLAAATMIGGDEDDVLINDRRGAKTLMHLEIAARSTIKAEHKLLIGLHIRRREQDLIADDNRRSMPATTHGGLPDEIFALASPHRQFLTRSRMAITGRAAPRGPIGGKE